MYALVGVAGILAASCRVPLTSVLLLFELTRDYALILPTLLAVGLSFWAVQFCLRGLAALAAYTPDFSGAFGDTGPNQPYTFLLLRLPSAPPCLAFPGCCGS